jgi:aspartate carbamoyltransferase
LLAEADEMKDLVRTKGGDDRLKHKVLASVFYEASTRTSCSFVAAMQRLGGTVVPVNEQHSSAQKGESIRDTAQTLACYCDAIVLRHPMKGAAAIAVSASSKPVINAGDGTGEHPTQALLDAYTIKTELGHIGAEGEGPPMVITLLGDLKHGRTVHSLVRLLSMFPGIKLNYVAPASLAMPTEIIEEIGARGVEQTTTMTLDEAIETTDVLYVTRVQKERFESFEEYEVIAGCYCVDAALMKKAKQKMIVMHPLPRVNEIHTDVDQDPRAAYFRQMEYGMYMRMAILSSMLLKRDV